MFRVKGASADSVSYSIVIANMLVPFLDKLPMHKPLGYGIKENRQKKFPKAAINLFVIALLMGLALSTVYSLTKDKIEEQQKLANAESYKAVLPDAENFAFDDDLTKAVEEVAGNAYDEASFGRTYINDVALGKDADGNVVGYVVAVTTADGFDGNIALSVGIDTEGTVKGIAFTELKETAGMGMRVDEDTFKDQFKDVNTDAFTLNKKGDATEAGDINTISGASTTSGAVVNAVNTALAFYSDHIK